MTEETLETENQTSHRQAPWSFNRHPLVSTILWILGTEIQTTPKAPSPSNRNDSKDNILSWKDDHGGHIAEYVARIQSERDSSSIEEKSPISSNKYNIDSAKSQISNSNQPYIYQYARPNNQNGTNDDQVNPSPQWGFYVSITPPQDSYPGTVGSIKK